MIASWVATFWNPTPGSIDSPDKALIMDGDHSPLKPSNILTSACGFFFGVVPTINDAFDHSVANFPATRALTRWIGGRGCEVIVS